MYKSIVNMLIIVIMQLLYLNGELFRNKEEPLCITTNILCVKDAILKIAKATNDVSTLGNGIEQSIRKKEKNEYSFQQNINRIRNRILSYSDFPTSKSHDRFKEMNNIVRSDLVHLMIEEHDAVSYLYYSINNLIRESFFDHEHDNTFDDILQNLQHNMLCNYRNILHVYSEDWQVNTSTNSIQLTRRSKQLLRQWTQRIDNALNNLENKLM